MAWVRPQAEIEAGLRDNPQVVAGVGAVAEELQRTAIGLARVRAFDSGEYAGSIIVVALGGGSWMVVATAPHAWFVEVGTGVHGPRARMIYASEVTAHGMFKFEVDDGAGGKRTVITPEHRGRPARHIMRDSAQQVAAQAGMTWRPSASRAW